MIPQRDRDIFENLFILELANNHWGSVERGLKIESRARQRCTARTPPSYGD